MPSTQSHTSYEGRDLEVMAFAKRYHRWILNELQPFLGSEVIEVGAGSGNFSSFLLETNIKKLLALEPSKEMYPLLVKKLASEPRATVAQALFGDMRKQFHSSFDSVVYINVLEHIEKDAQELRYMYESLKPGGHVCIFVPALQQLYSETDAALGHYRRYTKPQLKQLLTEAGFDIVRITYFDIVGILPWFVFCKLLKKKLQPGDVALYDTLVVPIMRTIESMLYIPIGKNLLAVGKKSLN